MTSRAQWLAAAALVLASCGTGDRKTEVEYNCPANALEIEVLQREIARF